MLGSLHTARSGSHHAQSPELPTSPPHGPFRRPGVGLSSQNPSEGTWLGLLEELQAGWSPGEGPWLCPTPKQSSLLFDFHLTEAALTRSEAPGRWRLTQEVGPRPRTLWVIRNTREGTRLQGPREGNRVARQAPRAVRGGMLHGCSLGPQVGVDRDSRFSKEWHSQPPASLAPGFLVKVQTHRPTPHQIQAFEVESRNLHFKPAD